MKLATLVALASCLTLAPLFACDSESQGPLTSCASPLLIANPNGFDFGERCETDKDCKYNWCIRADEFAGVDRSGPNITNSVFNYCSRGCDCNDTAESNIDYPDGDIPEAMWSKLVCLYAPGGTGDWHNVVPKCSTVTDCKEIDQAYTVCKVPHAGTVQKVCHAE